MIREKFGNVLREIMMIDMENKKLEKEK